MWEEYLTPSHDCLQYYSTCTCIRGLDTGAGTAMATPSTKLIRCIHVRLILRLVGLQKSLGLSVCLLLTMAASSARTQKQFLLPTKCVHEIIRPRDSQGNTTQYNSPKTVIFKEKMTCLRQDLTCDILHSRQMVYQLSY